MFLVFNTKKFKLFTRNITVGLHISTGSKHFIILNRNESVDDALKYVLMFHLLGIAQS